MRFFPLILLTGSALVNASPVEAIQDSLVLPRHENAAQMDKYADAANKVITNGRRFKSFGKDETNFLNVWGHSQTAKNQYAWLSRAGLHDLQAKQCDQTFPGWLKDNNYTYAPTFQNKQGVDVFLVLAERIETTALAQDNVHIIPIDPSGYMTVKRKEDWGHPPTFDGKYNIAGLAKFTAENMIAAIKQVINWRSYQPCNGRGNPVTNTKARQFPWGEKQV